MRRWAPANYQHACELVEAETARVLNHTAEAMALYDQSIASAIQNGYTNIEALANERAGLFYLGLGREKIAPDVPPPRRTMPTCAGAPVPRRTIWSRTIRRS